MIGMNKKFLIIIFAILILSIFLIQKQKIDYRPEYCENEQCIPEIIFDKLPSYPKDFSLAMGDVEEIFYKQPDFYPTWKDQGIEFYLREPSPYVGIIGYGCYPGETSRRTQVSQNLSLIFFIHTSWCVVKYQGMSLDLDYEKEYFDVKVEPKEILLEPTCPVFFSNWTQKVRVNIYVNENTGPGKYFINITAIDPPKDILEKWSRELKENYTQIGMIYIGRPLCQISLEIQ